MLVLVPEQQRDGPVRGDLGVGARPWIELTGVNRESLPGERAGRLRSGGVGLHVEPLVRVLRHPAMRGIVARVVRDDVHARKAQALGGAQHGGDVVRVEQTIEHHRDAAQARADDRLDARQPLRRQQRFPERVVAFGLGLAGPYVPAEHFLRQPGRPGQLRRIEVRLADPGAHRTAGTHLRFSRFARSRARRPPGGARSAFSLPSISRSSSSATGCSSGESSG